MRAIGDAVEPRADGARDVRREVHLHLRYLDLGTLGLDDAIEEQFDVAVDGDQRDAVTFEDAEIGDVAQVIALPGIAVEHHVADAGLAHGGHEA